MKDETFGVAAFRSRQHVLAFESTLRRKRIRCSVVSTPRDVAIGCGLSVRFAEEDLSQVVGAYNETHPANLIGIFIVERRNGRANLRPVAVNR